MTSLRDVAKMFGVSYEAVRKQVSRYADDLEGHISQQGRVRYLDDYAIEYLKQARSTQPVVVIQESNEAKISELEEDKAKLQNLVFELQNKIDKMHNEIEQLQDDKIELIEMRGQNQLLLTLNEKAEEQLQETKDQLTESREKVSELEKENSKYHRTIFGLYKKVEN